MLGLFYDQASGDYIVTEEAQKIIHDLAIDRNEPGTILRDFATLLEFVGGVGLKTSGKYCLLPQGQLDELNQRMSRPVPHLLKRPQQRSFPHLHGLYLVLRASGLGVVAGASPHSRLVIDPEMFDIWNSLNPTEQYFGLLENWLLQGSPEIIGEREHWASGCLRSLDWVYGKLHNHGRGNRMTRGSDGVLYGTMEHVTVALMESFGWLRLDYAQPLAGKGVQIAAIERLPLADAMANVLAVASSSPEHGSRIEEGLTGPGLLQPAFQPFFPEWQRTLTLPKEDFREGVYSWRVSLGKAWRRIVAPADSDLDDLAATILNAFEFDCDHLYCFELRDRRGRAMRIACPYEDDAAAFTDEVSLGDLPLPPGSTMDFIFDYGDMWKFAVKLEDVKAENKKLKHPKVTAKQGKPPAQYDWD